MNCNNNKLNNKKLFFNKPKKRNSQNNSPMKSIKSNISGPLKSKSKFNKSKFI